MCVCVLNEGDVINKIHMKAHAKNEKEKIVVGGREKNKKKFYFSFTVFLFVFFFIAHCPVCAHYNNICTDIVVVVVWRQTRVVRASNDEMWFSCTTKWNREKKRFKRLIILSTSLSHSIRFQNVKKSISFVTRRHFQIIRTNFQNRIADRVYNIVDGLLLLL